METDRFYDYVLITDPNYKNVITEIIYTDVLFKVGENNSRFNTNLCIFSLFSKRIRKVMKDSFKNGTPVEELEFKEIDADDFSLLHELIIKGQIKVVPKNALSLLRMGTFFEIDCLVNFLTKMIEEDIEFLESVDLFIFSFESQRKSLIATARKRIRELREAPFFSESLEKYISMGAFESLLSTKTIALTV